MNEIIIGENTFLPSDLAELSELERHIEYNFQSIAVSLKKIKDKKLYLLRECISFEEYCQNFVPFSASTAKRYVLIADKFSSSPHFDQIAQLPKSALVELAKDTEFTSMLNDGEIRTADGEIISIDALIAQGNIAMQTELAELKKKLEQKKSEVEIASQKLQLVETERDVLLQNNTDLPKLKKKKEIEAMLHRLKSESTSIISGLNQVEPSTDPVICSEVGALLGQLLGGLTMLRDEWIPYFTTETFVVGEQK